MENKIVELFKSGIKENVDLAMTICKSEHPVLWAAMLGVTGAGEITTDILNQIASTRLFSIGNRVRYKGMDSSPYMVISKAELIKTSSIIGVTYHTKLTCKYYNKSTQAFCMTEDRAECFEVIEEDKK